jgi:hypothetical protein
VAASLVPFAVWLDGSLTLDRFAAQVQQHPSAFRVMDGHLYSGYPIALPLLLTPLYAPAALLVRAGGWDVARTVVFAGILEKLAASLVAALSVVLFYYLARRLADRRRAILVTLAYAFATETWTISSQALWQHGGSELAVIAALLFLMRSWERPQSRGALVLTGLLAALAVAIRPTNILFLGAVLCWLLASRCAAGRLALFLAAPAVTGAALLAYNLHVFGQVTGGYAMDFDGAFWPGLAGLLASPGRGLLVYTPIALFSILGAVVWLRRGRLSSPPAYLVSILFSISMILLVSKWRVWWGGHCYGPRLLTDVVPCLVLLLLPALQWMSAKPLLRACFGVALAASAFLQMVGAFCYPGSRWDETPVAIGDRPARLWDWKDSPVTRSLAAGPRLGPELRLRRQLLETLRGGTQRTGVQ